MRKLLLHGLIEERNDRYTAICLELDVATEGGTLKEAEANLREAVALYLEEVLESGDEKEFIPRPAPREKWLKFFKVEASVLSEQLKSAGARGIELENRIYA